MPRKQFQFDDRGVRDVIGFVLTFSIVVSAVGLTATTGYNQLVEFRESQQVQNAERAMELTSATLEELVEGRAVSQSSEVNLDGSSVTVVEPSSREVRITLRDGGSPCCGTPMTRSVGALRMTYQGTDLLYENGAMFRTSPQGNVALSRTPTVRCRDGVAMVTIVTLRPDGGTSQIQVGGGGTIAINSRVAASEFLYSPGSTSDDPDTIVVEVSSPADSGWQQYFLAQGEWTEVPGSPNTYRCSSLDTITVHHMVIDVSFST